MSDNGRIVPSFDRPRSAAAIAWVWIVIAVAGILSGIEDYFTARKLAAVRPDLSSDPNADAIVDRFSNLIGGTAFDLAIIATLSTIVIVGAIGLLKLRSWGRLTLIAMTWLALVGMLIAQPIWLWEFTDLATLGLSGLSVFEIMIWIMGLLQMAFTVIVFGLMLRSLHGRRIREAIRA